VMNYGERGRAVAKMPFSVLGGKLITKGTLDAEREMKFLVDPYQVDVTARAGAFRALAIMVENEEQQPIHISVRTRDVAFDPEGELLLSDPSNAKLSCANWVELSPTEFDLRPKQKRRVSARITLSKDAIGGRAGYIEFKASMLAGETKSLEGSAGTILLLTIPGALSIMSEITEVKVSQAKKDESVSFIISFKNNGNVHVIPKGKVVIKSSAGTKEQLSQRIGEVEFDEIMGAVLPQEIRHLTATYPEKLSAGKYSAEITIDYGGDNPTTAQHNFIVR